MNKKPTGKLSEYHGLIREYYRAGLRYTKITKRIEGHGLKCQLKSMQMYLTKWSSPDREGDLMSVEELGIEIIQRRPEAAKVVSEVKATKVKGVPSPIPQNNLRVTEGRVATEVVDKVAAEVVGGVVGDVVKSGGLQIAEYDHVPSKEELLEIAHRERAVRLAREELVRKAIPVEGWLEWEFWKSCSKSGRVRGRFAEYTSEELGNVGVGADGKLEPNWREAFWVGGRLEKCNEVQLKWLRDELARQTREAKGMESRDRQLVNLAEGEKVGIGEYWKRRKEEAKKYGKLMLLDDSKEVMDAIANYGLSSAEVEEMRNRLIEVYFIGITRGVEERLTEMGVPH